MAERKSEGVSGVRRRRLPQSQVPLHHKRHLPLLGVSMTDHRRLHPRRSVLVHRHAPAAEGDEQRAPRLRKRKRGARQGRGEGNLKDGNVRPLPLDEFIELIGKPGQDQRPFGSAWGTQAPA